MSDNAPQPSELVETPEAFNKKKERCLAYVEQHWKWGNLTRLGIVNQLVRDGFRQTWAIEQADRIAPAANQAVAHITQLEAQIAKLQARLEVVPGWSEDADGIACRNDTIKLQDECIAKLQADGDKLAEALEAFQRHYDLNDCDERCGALEVPISDLRRARQALTEWKDRAMSDSDKPAFPQHPGIQCDGPPTDWHGMTLRDWFAGQAMAAIIAKIPFQEFPADWLPYEKTAIGAYDYADAMLEARKAKP